MINFDDSVEQVRAAARPAGSEFIPLAETCGRVLAAPIKARVASPRVDVSAMDGYAVCEADLAILPASLPVIGEAFAGQGWDGQLKAGECVRIFTGAPVPEGAGRVVIQENVRRERELALIEEHPGKARHIRKRGGDFREGEEVLPAGRSLDARAIVAVAAADVAQVEVFLRPRVTILSTGDELAEPGTAADSPNSIPESVSFGVAALARQWGGNVIARARIGDDLEAMKQAAAEAASRSELVIVTGGASVGERDFAKPAFEPLGLKLLFSKLAIKPGKPVWLGRAGETLVLGLPGNPTSALVTARLLLAPLLAGLTGSNPDDALRWRKAPIAAALASCGARETFHRARWNGGEVEILSNQDSSAQKALAQANLLVRQRAHAPALEPGAMVDVLDF